ncbi:Nif3-like dinuclear metal center hexameric protein [Spongisporangium articulatum]|uniref:GTP cyclohydrolase 1 type 2 homolog n=1 Tax=Spongisporangium articulatum TaxID=3362603 RepID=A0ABW8ALQ4_9ACTN
MTESRAASLAEVVAVLERMYDPSWARDWDAVGLVTGDPAQPVRKVLLAVDPSPSVVEEALAWKADLLLTHHPLLLKGVHSVAASTSKGRRLHALIKGDCALYTAHTNADVAAPGVSDALARVLGLTDLVPLSADPADPVDKLVTFVPESHVEKVIDALSGAGAGELGEYERCAWTTVGTGTFIPGAQATPVVGSPGEREAVEERRIEMIVPRLRRHEALAALRTAHPYEEPAVDLYELAAWSGPRGIGRVGTLPGPTSLREFAMLVAEALPGTAQGVRIAGEPTAEVHRVAVCGGSGDSLFDAVRAAGADVYVTADLRHHPASEVRDAVAETAPPFLVDVPHWASEWPWLAGVSNRLEGAMDDAGTPIEVLVSSKCTDPWTFRVPSPGGMVR